MNVNLATVDAKYNVVKDTIPVQPISSTTVINGTQIPHIETPEQLLMHERMKKIMKSIDNGDDIEVEFTHEEIAYLKEQGYDVADDNNDDVSKPISTSIP